MCNLHLGANDHLPRPAAATAARLPRSAAVAALPLSAAVAPLPLSAAALENLESLGYSEMTPVQAGALPLALAGLLIVIYVSYAAVKMCRWGVHDSFVYSSHLSALIAVMIIAM